MVMRGIVGTLRKCPEKQNYAEKEVKSKTVQVKGMLHVDNDGQRTQDMGS